MPRVLNDTSVLFATVYSRDVRRERPSPSSAVSTTDPSEGTYSITCWQKPWTGSNARQGGTQHDISSIERNSRFHVERLASDGLAGTKSPFRQYDGLSLVDASLLSSAERHDVEFLYASDDDFDVDANVRRLTEPIDPDEPGPPARELP